jgi:hypothetical protein
MDGASFHATLPREIRLFQKESNIAMRRYFTVGAAAIVIVSPIMLSACSSSSKPAAASKATTASSASAAPATAHSSAASASGKPALAAVNAGLLKVYVKQPGFSDNQAKAFANCMAPKLYGEMTAGGLKAAAAGDPTKVTAQPDKVAITRDGLSCHKVLKF